MKIYKTLFATLLSAAAFTAWAQAPAPASTADKPAAHSNCVKKKLSTNSLVGELLEEPAAKNVLIKHVPELKDNEQFEMAGSMSMRSMQPYAEETFSDKVLDAIDADLAKLEICK